MNDGAKKTFSERYWPQLLGLGAGSNIYLRVQHEPGRFDVLIGLVGLTMILAGVNGVRTFNRKQKGPIANQVIEPTFPPAEAEKISSAGHAFGPIRRLSQRLKAARFLATTAVLYILAAVFVFIHVPTTVGERWVWQLHEIEATSSTFEEVVLLPSYLGMHQAEVLLAALLVLYVGYFRSESMKSAHKMIWAVARRYAITISGVAFIAPIIFVPCTYIIRWRCYEAVCSGFGNDYRWLWDLGGADVKFSVLFLEEVIVAAIGLMIFAQYKWRKNS